MTQADSKHVNIVVKDTPGAKVQNAVEKRTERADRGEIGEVKQVAEYG
jgi:hypothetical protein